MESSRDFLLDEFTDEVPHGAYASKVIDAASE